MKSPEGASESLAPSPAIPLTFQSDRAKLRFTLHFSVAKYCFLNVLGGRFFLCWLFSQKFADESMTRLLASHLHGVYMRRSSRRSVARPIAATIASCKHAIISTWLLCPRLLRNHPLTFKIYNDAIDYRHRPTYVSSMLAREVRSARGRAAHISAMRPCFRRSTSATTFRTSLLADGTTPST